MREKPTPGVETQTQRRLSPFLLAALAVSMSLHGTSGFAKGTAVPLRTFKVGTHGDLVLSVPLSWRHNVKKPPAEMPPTIEFSPEEGHAFAVLITPFWSPQGDLDFNSPEQVKLLVKALAMKKLPEATDLETSLEELRGPAATGYLFSMVDPNAKADDPQDYKYLTTGCVATGGLIMTVTILTHEAEAPEVKAAYEMLRSAEHKVPKPAESSSSLPAVEDGRVVDRTNLYSFALPDGWTIRRIRT